MGGKSSIPFEEGLAKWNLTPEDVDVVIHTHLHNDHCENDYKCVNAKIYVHEKEMRRIHDPHPLDFRYLEDYIEDVEENGQIEVVTNDQEIVPGISCLHTPVHTDGGMSVVIDTDQGKAIITGFCVIKENFDPPVEIKSHGDGGDPPRHGGEHTWEAYDIMMKVRDMADILIPLHEPEFASMATIP